jgi:hypothetical protein
MAKKKKSTEPAKKVEKAESEKPSSVVSKRIEVDYWRTSAHSEELGIHKGLKYSAKSRYFTDSFDIEGTIIIDGDESKKEVIAYNEKDWEDPDIAKRGLKVRTFSAMHEGKGGNFQGGVELSITDSLIQTYHIKEDPGIVLVINLPQTKNLVRITRSRRLKGWKFAFPLIPEKSGEPLRMFEIRGKVGLGLDFEVTEKERKIANVDGKKLNIGGKWEIEIFDEELSDDKAFVKTLALFGCACKFLEDCEKLIKQIFKKFDDPKSDFKFVPDKQELDLFKNPRRLKA